MVQTARVVLWNKENEKGINKRVWWKREGNAQSTEPLGLMEILPKIALDQFKNPWN